MKEKDDKIAPSAHVQHDIIEELSMLNSDLQKSLKKQKRLTEMKSRFVSISSHEFRTPLTTIQTNVELLMFDMKDDVSYQQKKKSKYFNRILTEIDRLTGLMNDILMLGRLESQKIKFEPSRTSIIELCNNIIQEKYNDRQDGRKVELKIIGNNILYNIDSSIYKHIITNLLSNAFKFSSGRKNPQIKLACYKDHFNMDIIDRGIGIPDEEKVNIFQTFFRASNNKYIDGTGLGLSIVKQFVKLHKGRINFESDEGLGTIFSIHQSSIKLL